MSFPVESYFKWTASAVRSGYVVSLSLKIAQAQGLAAQFMSIPDGNSFADQRLSLEANRHSETVEAGGVRKCECVGCSHRITRCYPYTLRQHLGLAGTGSWTLTPTPS